MSVVPLRAHEVVEFRGAPVYVWSACDAQIVAYVCITCDQEFPTRKHLAEHVKAEGDHVVGRLCAHGLEAPPAKEAA